MELLQSSVSWFDSLDEMKKHVNPIDGKVYYFGIKAVDHLDQVNTCLLGTGDHRPNATGS